MTTEEERAIATVCLLAAFADGSKNDAERAAVKRVVASLPAAGASLPLLYQDALLQRVPLAQAVQPLADPETRQLAYEMAVGVCEADDRLADAEKSFLETLRGLLGLDPEVARKAAADTEAVAFAPVSALPPMLREITPVAAPSPPADAALDQTILNYSILNGALELLPQSLSTVAILALQMKLVYAVGKAHGHELDRGHIKEFLAAAGVGLASQAVEGYLVRLSRGLLGKVAGGVGRAVGGQAASSLMSFATTYALGQVARRYYAGGRRLSTEQLRESFSGLLGEGRTLQQKYLPEIQRRAATLSSTDVMKLVAGR
ncbi:MAG: YcjF family protein [Limisphaerales bacterium]